MSTPNPGKISQIDQIRRRYGNSGHSVQEKAVSLTLLNASLTVGFLVLGAIRLIGGSIVTGLAEIGISLVLVVLVFAIRRGAFKLASVVTVLLFLIAATALFLVQEITGPVDIYRQTTYMIPVFTTAPLLAYAGWQVILIVGSGSLVVVAQYMLRIRPAMLEIGFDGGLTEFLVALLLTVFTALFTWQTFRMQQRTLRLVQDQAMQADERATGLKELIGRLSAAFNVGARLKEGAGDNAEAAKTLTDRIATIAAQLASLRSQLETTQLAHERIEEAKDKVEQVTRSQTEVIEANDSTIRSLSGQVVEMRDDARSRSSVIEQLLGASSRAAETLERSRESFRAMQDSSMEILGVIAVIQKVSARTNLLAMNAAIEAAHAGAAGRGFAVVAEEIRKLADETQQNTLKIRGTVDRSQQRTESSIQEGEQLSSVFSEISRSVEDVHAFLTGVVDQLNKVATGHRTVDEKTHELDAVNTSVRRTVSGMTEALASESAGLIEVAAGIGEIERILAELRAVADENMEISAGLEAVGQDNVRSFAELQQSLNSLS